MMLHALALIAIAQAAAPSAPATASPVAPPAYCAMIPLKSNCEPLTVAAPRAGLKLAVVSTFKARERGLMFVPNVPAGEGMLFAFSDGDSNRPFWMKDTITPLDMVWVNAGGMVTAVAPNVPKTSAGTPDDVVAQRTGIGEYVIELRAGDAARTGITVGTHLVIPPIAAE